MWTIVISILIIGLILLIVELVFIPGTTVVGIIGVIFSIVGVVIGFEQFGNQTGFYLLIGTLLATLVTLFISFRYGAWKKFSLNSSMEGRFNERLTTSLKVGDTGISVSTLRPFGKADFDSKIYEVRTTGKYVPPGQQLVITSINRNQIIVETKDI